MNKSVGWLDKFQNKIIALLVVSTLIPVLILGVYSVTSTTETISQLSVNLIEQETAQRSSSIVNFLQRIGEDVLFLREMPPVQGIIRARENKGFDQQDKSSYEGWVNRLNTIFIGMMKNRPYYYQISYLDEKGNEMVQINSENGSLKPVSGADMQNNVDSDSFKETIKLGEGELYFSEVGLNQERGKIEIPHNPVIEVGTPIYSPAGKRKGIIVAKVFAKYFLAAKSGNWQQEDKTIFVLNSRGYYLSHPDPQKEYGLELKTEQNVTKDYPEIIANKLLSGGHGLITEGTEYLLSYYTLYPNSKQQKNPLIFVAQLSKQKVFASINSFKTVGINISIISLAAVLGLGIIIVRNIVNLIRQLTGAVSSFSVQVVSTLDEQERLSSQQSSSVQETTVTMEELNTSAQKSTVQAEAAAAGAKVALSKVEDGNECVQQALVEMETLKAKVGEISDQIGRLSEQANQIGTISKVVSDLANQTNMLALNAAVEAVRAGESGKGFSVVAKEIRSLADRSKKSAHTINTLVVDIQRAVAATVKVTGEGKKSVDMAVKIAQKTAEAFAGVGGGMDGIVTNTQQIALNAKQQAVAIQQVVDVMNALNQGAAEAATGIRETKAGTQQLREAALRLKEAV